MRILYSSKLDVLISEKIKRNIPIYSHIKDWQRVTKEQADLFYYGTTMPEGKRRKAGTLELEDIPPPTSEEICQQCKDSLAAKRWEISTNGVVIDGVNIQSCDESSNEMSKYVTESIVNGLVNVNWKLSDGTFKVYTVQQFNKVYQIVANYRNDCFGVEMDKQEEIETAEDPTTVDIETGWPTREFTTS